MFFQEIADECVSLIENSEDKSKPPHLRNSIVSLVLDQEIPEVEGPPENQRLSRKGASQKFCASTVKQCDGAAATAAAYKLSLIHI